MDLEENTLGCENLTSYPKNVCFLCSLIWRPALREKVYFISCSTYFHKAAQFENYSIASIRRPILLLLLRISIKAKYVSFYPINNQIQGSVSNWQSFSSELTIFQFVEMFTYGGNYCKLFHVNFDIICFELLMLNIDSTGDVRFMLWTRR